MRILVTGGAGFIGSHVAAASLEAGHTVFVLDNLSTGNIRNVPSGGDFVEGDITNRSLVSNMLQGNGYTVVDLGINCSTDKFMLAIEEHKPDICGLSAMLTTTMRSMQATVAEVKARLPNQLIIVGGAPVNKKFADKIAADAYGVDAMRAVDIVNDLLHGA